MEVRNELYCHECEYSGETDYPQYECPSCGSEDVSNSKFGICSCGTTVYLDRFTNECMECGALYNGFGQLLATVDEWDDEDRYGSFGPQNYMYADSDYDY